MTESRSKVFSAALVPRVAVTVPRKSIGWVEFSTSRVAVVEVEAVGPSALSQKREICACAPVVETYVRRSILVLEVLDLVDVGGQVKMDCGGSAYEVINLDEAI